MCRCNTGPWLFSGLLSPLFFTLHLRQDIDATFVKSRLISAKLIARPPLRRQLSRSRMLCRKECTAHAIETGSRYLRHNVRPFVRPRGCGQVETLCVLRVSMRGMARSGRFELPTPRFVVWCSIQLSYERFVRRGAPSPAEGWRTIGEAPGAGKCFRQHLFPAASGADGACVRRVSG